MPQASSRICPSCGRQVPRTIAKCRCGAMLPATAFAADEEPRSTTSTVVIAAALALALLGTGYWTLFHAGSDRVRMPVVPGSADPGPHHSAGAPGAADHPPASTTAAVGGQLTPEQAEWNAGAGGDESLAEMIDRAMPAIVLVETQAGRGSAFFIRPDTLLTNAHVVQRDAEVTLEHMDGSTLNARVEDRFPTFDIAVLKVSAPSRAQEALTLGSISSLKVGQEVVVIGSSLGTLQNSASRGIVSGIRDKGGVTVVQSDARAYPGNSGGPMLDQHGRVVGILTGGYQDGSGISFAVAIDHARDLLAGKVSDPAAGGGLSQLKPAMGGAAARDPIEQFEQRMITAAEGAEQIDAVWERFRRNCYKEAIPGAYEREWFAVYEGLVPATAGVACQGDYDALTKELERFRNYMRSTVVNARDASVLLGTIRDRLRASRLNRDW